MLTVVPLVQKNQALTSQLHGAAINLSRTAATHYTGKITAADGTRSQINLMVTNTGTTRGTITEGADTVQVLATDGKTFLQVDQTFWQKSGVDATKAAIFSKQWVMIAPDEFGLRIEDTFAPAKLGNLLAQAANSRLISDGPVSLVNGISTRQIRTLQGIVYVTTSAPYRIVRITSSTSPNRSSEVLSSNNFAVGGSTHLLSAFMSRSSDMAGASAPTGDFDVFIDDMPDAEIQNLFAQLRTNLEQLRDAINSEVKFTLDGDVVLQPCDISSCTAQVTIKNQMSTSNPNVKLDQPITVEVYIYMTLDGVSIKDCPEEVTMLPNSSVPVPPCVAEYTLPEDGRMHPVLARVEAVGKALVSVDILRMANDLKSQTLSWRLREAGLTGLPGWSDSHGSYRFVPPENYNPESKPLEKENGSYYLDVYGNEWREGGAHGLAAVRGFPREWDVTLSRSGYNRWKSIAVKSKSKRGGYYANITPDGDVSHS
jgi:hypothetical protein